jgi:delta1-piperideine-2-carboxylate reductase
MEGAHMPGNRRYANRAKSAAEGIVVSDTLLASCKEFLQPAG